MYTCFRRNRSRFTIPVLIALIAALLAGCAEKGAEPAPAAAAEEPRSVAHRDVRDDMLLIVDFQNVYLPGNEWACPSMPEAMENTIRILESPNAPDYIMTRYIAPAEPVGRWNEYNEAYREINENEYLSEISEPMTPYAAEGAVIDKSTYSSMDAPEVIAALEGKKAVVLAGVVADCCVLATMYDAMDLGYEVVYLYDCIGGASPESEAEIRALAEIFTPIHTSVMSSEEYLAAIG